MRHIPDGIEPQELKEFRVARPNATWDDFRNEAQDAYKRLLEQVVSHQCGLCAYCEIDLSETDRMIEHFHPKSDMSSGHNWGLDFENMLATCKGVVIDIQKMKTALWNPCKKISPVTSRKATEILMTSYFILAIFPSYHQSFKLE
jgi:5-methylcytosine-specific restriction endonuclease McrA